MATSADRNTSMQDGEVVVLTVAAAKTLYAGAMGAVNAAGDVLPAADAAGLKVVGRIEEYVDNSAGAAADKTVKLRRLRAFWYANSGTAAVTKAHLHGLASIYIEDDETVSSATGTNSIIAGTAIQLDATFGVLIWFD
ncbi:MAG: hypothetical protein JRC99_00090 [Deltaproteobacteria bacterium]|nr:hypothetical protein [Deltaproteobacteria bacterium]